MPVLHREDRGVAVLEYEGTYQLAEARAVLTDVMSRYLHRPAAGLLLDFSRSESLHTRSADDVRTMAHFLTAFRDRYSRRVAAVAPSDLAYGLMRMGSVPIEEDGLAAHVSRDYESALRWLLGQSDEEE
jgi:hypothetical protein